MHTLLIIDDDRWVRQGLRMTLNWEKEGIEVVGDAEDGEEALDLIKLHKPDIILMDINMPGMDGLALLEILQNQKISIKVIVISGYKDFSYAQKAIRYGVSDYILKPIQEHELLEVVRKCKNELGDESLYSTQMQKLSSCLRESLPLARSRFFEMLLNRQTACPPGDIDSKWDALGIPLDPDRISVLAIKINYWGTKDCEDIDCTRIRNALGNISEEVGTRSGSVIACPLNSNDEADLAVLYSFQSDRQEPVHSWMPLINEAYHYLGIRISIGISRERNRSMLFYSFEEALNACAHYFYEGCEKVYDASVIFNGNKEDKLYSGPDDSWETQLLHAMKLGNEKLLEQMTEEFVQHLHALQDKFSPLGICRGLAMMMQNISKKWEACYPQHRKFKISSCSLQELKNELKSALLRCSEEARSSGNLNRVVELALNYTREHFMEGITMNTVAEQIHVNPCYFSKVFHEEMGETFSKYLIRLRMSKAKELLKGSTLKIYEIAEQVGYNDFRHFGRMFKDIEGITPAQYRDVCG